MIDREEDSIPTPASNAASTDNLTANLDNLTINNSKNGNPKPSYTRPPNHYNPTCHVNGGGMASVFLSCCAPELNFLSGGGGDMATSPLTTPMNSETQSTDNIVGGSSSNNDGENEGKVGRSNVWSEKAQREERGKEDYSEDGRQQQRLHHDVDGGKKSPDFPNIGILPLACGQHLPKNKSPNKPFASTTLLDRGDSLLEQGSLLSLMASESETPLSSSHHCHFPKEVENDNDDYSAEGTQHGEDKSLFSTTNPVTNIDIHTTPPRPTRQELSTPSAPPPSPAMELSMAKQEANVAQLSNTRLHAREGLRSFRDMSSAINSSPRSLRTHKEEKDIETVNNKQSLAAGDGSVGSKAVTTEINDDANKSARATMYSSFGNAEPTPLWEIDGVNSELKCTYQYPRLYLKDPAHVITNHKRALVDNEQGEFWWYHLAQRMETTLGHVCGHWKLLEQQKQQANLNSSDSVSVSSSVNTNAILERNENGFKHDSENGCSDAMVDLCFGKQTQTNHHRSKSWSKLKSKNKVVDNSNVMNHAMSSNSSVNAWSEPCASTMKVRGPKYSENGMKVDSNESIFAVLGVDNFVNGRDGGCVDHDSSKAGPATCNYLDRWKRVCDDVGLEQPPFLLVINFIVPWGSFQSYSFRSDADEGPFSSLHRDRASEKSWRSFVEGTADYRNKRLKLIPRVVAGPWVVKKMVGSTPCLIGTKVPVSYNGSKEENYLEITIDVTKGPAFGNTVANTVVGKAEAVTVDLGFVIEGCEEDGHLPEQMLTLFRLHHLDMKRAPTHLQWKEELLQHQQ